MHLEVLAYKTDLSYTTAFTSCLNDGCIRVLPSYFRHKLNNISHLDAESINFVLDFSAVAAAEAKLDVVLGLTAVRRRSAAPGFLHHQ